MNYRRLVGRTAGVEANSNPQPLRHETRRGLIF